MGNKAKPAPPRNVYGGEFSKRRAGRVGPRPLEAGGTIHLVMKSTQAKGERSFRHNEALVKRIVRGFAGKYGLTILAEAYPFNHIHLHLQLKDRESYLRFVRATAGTIAFRLRDKRMKGSFWSQRPFSRIVSGRTEKEIVDSYVLLNELEASGIPREAAREYVRAIRALK